MNHETALKLTADITVSTIQYMAEKAGISFDETFFAILAGGNARKKFDELMKVASEYIREAA